jgi:hypothetical protein
MDMPAAAAAESGPNHLKNQSDNGFFTHYSMRPEPRPEALPPN